MNRLFSLRRSIRQSIQSKILLSFMAVSLVPLSLLGWVSYSWYAGLVESRTSEYNAELFRTFTGDMDQFLQQVELFSFIAYQENFQALWKVSLEDDGFTKVRSDLAMNELILRQEEFYNFRGIIQSATLLDEEGSVFYENTITVKNDYQFDQELWFDSLRYGGKSSLLIGPYLSQPWLPQNLVKMEAPVADDYRLTYIRKVSMLERPQNTLGYIMLHFSLKEVQKFLDPIIGSASGTMIIVDRDGTIVYDPDFRQIGKPINENMRVQESNRGGYTVIRENGHRYLVTSTSLKMVDWDIYSKNDLEELLSGGRDVRNITLLFVAVSLILAYLAAHLLSVGLVTPIKRLKNAMVKVSQGNLSVQAGKLSNDEIGDLGRYFDDMIAQIKYLVEQVYKAELHEREARLSALQAQINPHFLYNTLETINSIAVIEGVSKVSEIARALSDMFRYNTKTGGLTVILAEEVRHIRNYLKIISIRFEDKLSVNIDIPEELMMYRMIKLVFQPIVENAVFHGIESKRGKGTLSISGMKEQEDLLFVISDDGTGMSEEQLETLRGRLAGRSPIGSDEPSEGKVGIKNVHDRIRFYYGEAYGITLDSKPGLGTQVTIRIPAVLEQDVV